MYGNMQQAVAADARNPAPEVRVGRRETQGRQVAAFGHEQHIEGEPATERGWRISAAENGEDTGRMGWRAP